MKVLWKSAGRALDPIFIQRLTTYSEVVIPNMGSCLFPAGIWFKQSRIVTLDWDTSTFNANINRWTFPYAERIEIVGSTQLLSEFDSDLGICHTTGDKVLEKNGQVRWMYDEWVNKEWLLSQFNELFAKFQEMQQNELNRQLR